jgi:hypothetical protein
MSIDESEARAAAQSIIDGFGGDIDAVPHNIKVLVERTQQNSEAHDKHGLKTPAGLDHHFFIDKLGGLLRETHDRFEMSNPRSSMERNERWQCVARRAWEEIARVRPERMTKLLDNLAMVMRRVSPDLDNRVAIILDDDHIAELSKAYPGVPYPHTVGTLVQKLLNEAWLTVDGKAAQAQARDMVPLTIHLKGRDPIQVGEVPRMLWDELHKNGSMGGFSIGGQVDIKDAPEEDMEREPELLDVLTKRLADWLAREAPRVRDETQFASIKFTITDPQGDDDEALYLSFRAEEESIVEDRGGRVSGVKFR